MKPNTASLFETDCWGHTPIDYRRAVHPWLVLLFFIIGLAYGVESFLGLITYIQLVGTERWWNNHFDKQMPPIHVHLDWATIGRLVEVNDCVVSARADFFHDLYTKELSSTTNTLHRFINLSIFIYKRCHISLRWVFPCVGVIAFFFMPYIAVSMLCHHFFRNFHNVKTKGWVSILGHRKIRLHAKWVLHQQRSPPHEIESRCYELEQLASEFTQIEPISKSQITLIKSVLVCCGAFAAMIILITFCVGDRFLATNFMFGRSVAFFTACVGGIMALCSPLTTSSRSQSKTQYDIVKAMGNPYALGYDMAHSRYLIHRDFPLQYYTLLEETLSLFTTPFGLITSMPWQHIEDLVDLYFTSREEEASIAEG
jgi:hypothetical protein